jgi:hypothetical protein
MLLFSAFPTHIAVFVLFLFLSYFLRSVLSLTLLEPYFPPFSCFRNHLDSLSHIYVCLSVSVFRHFLSLFLSGGEEASGMAACFKSDGFTACAESYNINRLSTLSSETERHPQANACWI